MSTMTGGVPTSIDAWAEPVALRLSVAVKVTLFEPLLGGVTLADPCH
jgi:hypothetical protein